MKFLFDLLPVILFFSTYYLAGGGEKGGGCTVTPDLPITQEPILLSPLILGRTLVQAMLEHQISLPDRLWGRLNAAWIIFFVSMGAANLAAVRMLSCNGWVSFKFYGATSLMLIFIVGQTLFLAR